MDLKTLSDNSLHERNLQCAKDEREIITKQLYHLRETERRRLYSKYKCKSLFDYCVSYLKYSNDQADRKIKAMRLLNDVPELETKIISGSLTLTNLALAQRAFVQKKKSGRPAQKEEKLELLSMLENQSTREAEKIVYAIQPELRPKKNALDFNSIEDDALREKLLQVKGLFAHSDPNMSLTELLHKLADQELAKKTKAPFRAPEVNAGAKTSKAELKRRVWRRDQGKCVNCGSTYAVQTEHRIPKAVGGPDTMANLCLLCRSCNQRRAIEYYGMSKMQRYLKSPKAVYRAGA